MRSAIILQQPLQRQTKDTETKQVPGEGRWLLTGHPKPETAARCSTHVPGLKREKDLMVSARML